MFFLPTKVCYVLFTSIIFTEIWIDIRNPINLKKKVKSIHFAIQNIRAKNVYIYSPDATDVSVWVTEFLQQYNLGPCAGASSHPVSLYFRVHLQISSEPGKRGSLHSFQNDPKEILYRESLWKGRGRSWREKIYNIISERNRVMKLLQWLLQIIYHYHIAFDFCLPQTLNLFPPKFPISSSSH